MYVLPTDYQQFIHKSRYAKWLEGKGRRENWNETVDRYLDFFMHHTGGKIKPKIWANIRNAILNLDVMPSMRALMTAGEALEKSNNAGYNCSYVAMDRPFKFSEIMYNLMCLHPDTLVVTNNGDKRIQDIKSGDLIVSFEEESGKYVFKPVNNKIKTPSATKKKFAITLDNGTVVKCTHNHLWLTSTRGWVAAEDLTLDDDLVAPTYSIYKITNKTNNKSYIGFTEKHPNIILNGHLNTAKSANTNCHFAKTLRKYGNDCWDVVTIDVATSKQEAIDKEMYWIKMHDTKKNGYNLTNGGEGAPGYIWPQEQRHTKQTKATLSRAGLAKALNGENTTFYGRKHSENAKQKMRVAKQRRAAQ